MKRLLPERIHQWISSPAHAVMLGILLLAGLLLLWRWPTPLLLGYLVGWTFWLGIPVGTLGINLIHRLTGGDWGVGLLDQTENTSNGFTLFGALFIPVLLGMRWVYPWLTRQIIAPAEFSTFRDAFLRPGTFILRSILYFAVWLLIARTYRRSAGAAGLGLLGFVFIGSFAVIDWLGTLSLEFYSTIFGLYVLVAFALTALCVLILVALSRESEIPKGRMNDWGNLLLTFVMMHAYLAFSQFLIIWSGNLPREIGWYTQRMHGLWGAVGLLLVITQLFAPLLLLLMRDIKQRPSSLAAVAILILISQWIESAWLVLPSLAEWNVRPWQTITALAAGVLATAGIGSIIFPTLLETVRSKMSRRVAA